MNKSEIRIITVGSAPHWHYLSKTKNYHMLLYFVIGPIYKDHTIDILIEHFNYEYIIV